METIFQTDIKTQKILEVYCFWRIYLYFVNTLGYTMGCKRALSDRLISGALFCYAAESYMCSRDLKAPLAHTLSKYGFAAFFTGYM